MSSSTCLKFRRALMALMTKRNSNTLGKFSIQKKITSTASRRPSMHEREIKIRKKFHIFRFIMSIFSFHSKTHEINLRWDFSFPRI
jgi:hypothetical protein